MTHDAVITHGLRKPGTWPVLFFGLEVVADPAKWKHLGSPRVAKAAVNSSRLGRSRRRGCSRRLEPTAKVTGCHIRMSFRTCSLKIAGKAPAYYSTCLQSLLRCWTDRPDADVPMSASLESNVQRGLPRQKDQMFALLLVRVWDAPCRFLAGLLDSS